MKIDLFQSCGHCCVFQICWHIEFNSLTASSFRIWNSSAGIPSFPLALLLVMLLKVHLTLHSRMSASRWVTTLSWLSGSLRPFLYSYFVYSCSSLLKIFCFCQVHTISVLYCAHLCMKRPLVSLIFLMRALVFPIPLFSSISLHCSLKKTFLSLLFFGTLHSDGYIFPFLLCLLFLFFSQLLVSLLKQPFCLAALLLLGYGFGHCIFYNVMNLFLLAWEIKISTESIKSGFDEHE